MIWCTLRWPLKFCIFDEVLEDRAIHLRALYDAHERRAVVPVDSVHEFRMLRADIMKHLEVVCWQLEESAPASSNAVQNRRTIFILQLRALVEERLHRFGHVVTYRILDRRLSVGIAALHVVGENSAISNVFNRLVIFPTRNELEQTLAIAVPSVGVADGAWASAAWNFKDAKATL